MNLTNYTFNFDNIINHNRFLTSTRLLAAKLQKNPYMTMQDYLELVPDFELQKIVEMMDSPDLNEEVILLSELLSTAEGCKAENIDDVTMNVNTFMAFIVADSLSRKGLARVHRENMSFDAQYGTKPIVSKMLDS